MVQVYTHELQMHHEIKYQRNPKNKQNWRPDQSKKNTFPKKKKKKKKKIKKTFVIFLNRIWVATFWSLVVLRSAQHTQLKFILFIFFSNLVCKSLKLHPSIHLLGKSRYGPGKTECRNFMPGWLLTGRQRTHSFFLLFF